MTPPSSTAAAKMFWPSTQGSLGGPRRGGEIECQDLAVRIRTVSDITSLSTKQEVQKLDPWGLAPRGEGGRGAASAGPSYPQGLFALAAGIASDKDASTPSSFVAPALESNSEARGLATRPC